MNPVYVKELQRRLRLLSLMDDRYPSVEIDGNYNEKTAEAIRIFQRSNDLLPSGTADDDTVKKLGELYDDYVQLTADPHAVCVFPSPYFVMRSGENGCAVQILQAMLAEICSGFTSPRPPALSGTFDDDTRACVEVWQEVFGLPKNGEVDRFCWDRLADMYNMRLL